MNSDKSGAFTLIEVLAVIVIITALGALMAPAFIQTKGQAKATSCASNLLQLGVATELYLGDYDQQYPRFVNAIDRRDPTLRLGRPKDQDPFLFLTPRESLGSYVKDERIFRCPSDGGVQLGTVDAFPFLYPFNGETSYLFGELFSGQTPDVWLNPATAVWSCDGGPSWHSPQFSTYDLGTWKVMSLHYDWHVKLERGWSPTVVE